MSLAGAEQTQPDLFAPPPEATMAFVLRLRARGIADIDVLRALETVPRHLFVPHLYVDLAWRDVALPIACGQTMPEPWLVARMMEALKPAPDHRVLEIGAGSGYATAILARLAREVVSFERFGSLATEAATRLRQLDVANARVLHGDGLAPGGEHGVFERVLIHGVVERVPEAVLSLVVENGVVVFVARDVNGKCVLKRLAHENAAGWRETEAGACRATDMIPGLSTIF